MGIGQPSTRTRAVRMYHRENLPVDAVATRLGIPATEARDLIFGKPRPPLKRAAAKRRRKAISPASPKQRERVEDKACVVCRRSPCEPAHLIDKSLANDRDGDPRAVVPLCGGPNGCHRRYDDEDFDLLPYLEPHYREELAFAVERFGLVSTYKRVTGQRWVATERMKDAA